MAGLLRKKQPVVVPQNLEESDDNLEYSFALEYCGPPVSYDVPRVFPIDVTWVPIAATAATPVSKSKELSLPVVQPIARGRNDKLPKETESAVVEQSHSARLGCRGGRTVTCSNTTIDEVVDSPGAYLAAKHGCAPELSDGPESSGTACFTDSRCDNSQESSEISGRSRLPDDDRKDSVNFQHYLNPANWDLAESSLSSKGLTSRISSTIGDDVADDFNSGGPSINERSSSAVNSADSDSRDVFDEISIGGAEVQVFARQEITVKKGSSCYRCLKGNRFTKKEACIVCGAKYCRNCVLRVMGSMPEGRKCVTCIGYPAAASMRGTLGKSSRLLKQLLPELEVKRILIFETACELNRLSADHVFVNKKPLCQEEIFLLENCSNPPKKLKPGHYWYDKVSGLWGKEGKQPSQIITPQLNVGNSILRDASNGKTTILINSREITKPEVFMLKFAGVQCPGNTSFWLSADGFCQEEGQKNAKGPIWQKPSTKLFCALWRLPIPKEPENHSGKKNSFINGVGYADHRSLHKLLLVGCSRSGTSTLYKQAKMLYDVAFSEDERQNIKLTIQSSLYRNLGILLEGRERFEEESLVEMKKRQVIDQSAPSGSSCQTDGTTIYDIAPRLRAFSDWLLKVMVSGNMDSIFPAASHEYAPFVEELWKDAAIQATYSRRDELQMLPRSASYFLEKAVEVSGTDYEPSVMDILYAEGITSSNGLTCMEFSFPQSEKDDKTDHHLYEHDPSLRYELIRVHPKNLGENCKWLDMLADTEVVMFSVALTDYNQWLDGAGEVRGNKLLASRKLFESIVTHPTFCGKTFLLVLTKVDLLGEVIGQVPLSQCDWLSEFNPVVSHNGANNASFNTSLAQRAAHYVGSKFKQLFHMLTGRKLYVSVVNGLALDSVDATLKYAREILKWHDEKPNFTPNEWSSYSLDGSTSS